MTNTVFQTFQTQYIHQQAVAEHWDLPNTEIFQSKVVTSGVFIHSINGKLADTLKLPDTLNFLTLIATPRFET
jgi:hypothetical protein